MLPRPALSTLRICLSLWLPFAAALLAATAGRAQPADPFPLDDVLRVNHVQSKGTHNSYHLRSPLYPNGPPRDFDYEHAPIPVQLAEQGVRKFELDVYWDWTGFFRVHHVNYFDQATSCETLVLCLEQLRDWSLAHPNHHPIFVFVEPKGFFDPESPLTISDEPITGTYDDLDAEIRSVLAPAGGIDLLVTPDEVRGAHATLRDAILTDGWPTLRTTRGRFVFVMLDEGADRDGYAEGRPSLEGRAMFVTSSEGRADAAAFKVDGPVGGFDRIQRLVSLGYVVRTRSDAGREGQANDRSRLDAALASGAQILSTDYPVPEILGNGYWVEIPGGYPSGCNPISAAGLPCTGLDVENPAALAGAPPPGTPSCTNGADDDADGLHDLHDPGCPFPTATVENPACDDGVDQDGDGLVDFEDPQCEASWPYWEAPACGFGAELALVLAALRARRRLARVAALS